MNTPNEISATTPTTSSSDRNKTTINSLRVKSTVAVNEDIRVYTENSVPKKCEGREPKKETKKERKRKRMRESKLLIAGEKTGDSECEIRTLRLCTPSPTNNPLTCTQITDPCDNTPTTAGAHHITIYLYAGQPALHAYRVLLPIRPLTCKTANSNTSGTVLKRRYQNLEGQPEVIQLPLSSSGGDIEEEVSTWEMDHPSKIHQRSIVHTENMKLYYLLHVPSIILPSGRSLHEHLLEDCEENGESDGDVRSSPNTLMLRKVKEGSHGINATRVLMLPGPSGYSIVEDGGYYALESFAVKD